MKRHFKSAVYILLIFYGCGVSILLADDDPTYYVSIVGLLVDPAKFDGEKIAVVGYLAGTVNLRLYLTEGHASFSDSTSAIGVFEPRLQESKCLDQIVRVIGRFSDIGGRDYGLVDIEKIQITEDSSYRIVDCWRRNH